LGLAAPWATANLERYKMRNTFYGNLGGSFAASGGRLFLRGVLIWILIVGPLVAGIVAADTMTDWSALERAMSLGTFERAVDALRGNEQATLGIWLFLGGFLSSFIFGIALYPAYQAIVMRWWLGGLRLGGAAVASDLCMRRYYFAYLRYLLYVVLFSIAFVAAAAMVLGLAYAALRGSVSFAGGPIPRVGFTEGWAEIVAIACGIAAYVIYILGVSTIYQVVVKMRLWQVAVESVLISGIAALDHVQASDAISSAVGEGLADALGTGAI
jgi:uncharacterized membrane protein YjgN (DUF898 family)